MMSKITLEQPRPPKLAEAERAFSSNPAKPAWRQRRTTFRPPCQAALLGLLLAILGTPPSPAAAQVISGIPGEVEVHGVINFSQMAKRAADLNSASTNKVVSPFMAPPSRPKGQAVPGAQPKAAFSAGSGAPGAAAGGPQPFSPQTSINFDALDDNNTLIPPDTGGTVGPNHLMVALNSQIRIQDRNGANLRTMPTLAFWAILGVTDVSDPHVAYDPFNDRWIFTIIADFQTANSSVLMAVSQTGDPTGTWNLYRVTADPAGIYWADYPTLGFNKDWIVVSVNMYSISGSAYGGAYIWAFNKTNLYGNGVGTYTFLRDILTPGFTMAPAVTYDNTLPAVYLVDVDQMANFSSGNQLRISTISGTVNNPQLTLGTGFASTTNDWEFYEPNPGGSCPQLGSSFGIMADDSRIINVIYRNGSLWCSHTAFLPTANPDHSAAQWWQFAPDGTVQQFGRVEDPAGLIWYAYPSIAANKNNDVMLGYSSFSPLQYASANYSFRSAGDPPNTMEADTVLKAGLAPYFKDFGSGRNRWGDFSATVVDPVNDVDMWTIQEYAALPVAGESRWGTWWGKLDVVNLAISRFEFSSSTYSVAENTPGFATITVNNVGGFPGTVDYATSNGTAVAGIDYLPASGTLTFNAGQYSTNFSIIIVDNSVPNSNKTVNINLSNPTGGGVLGTPTAAVVTIVDDESRTITSTAGEFNFSATVFFASDAETFPAFTPEPQIVILPDRSAYGALITVTRSNTAMGRVLVDYATVPGGTAIPGIDYLPVSGTLVFDDFQMSTNFFIEIGPSLFPGFVFLNLQLSNPRPDPLEEAANPFLIRPTLGTGSAASLLIFDVNNGVPAPPPAVGGANAFNIERAWYRVDEYDNGNSRAVGGSRQINVDVVLLPAGGPGSVHVWLGPGGGPGSYGGLYGYYQAAGSDYADVRPFDIGPLPDITDPSLTYTNFGDYGPQDFVMTFGQGQFRKTLVVTVTNDSMVEFNEDILVQLQPIPGNPTVGFNPVANVTILFDDQPAGALDREWNPDFAFGTTPANNQTPGANNTVSALVVQPDGKTVLGGDFTGYNANPRSHFARINADGSIDLTFDPGLGADGFVSAIALYPTSASTNSGKILIAGGFTSVNGLQYNGIARINVDGSVDTTFSPGNGANAPVRGLALQPDEKILVSGDFAFFNDVSRAGFARLNPDGSVDLSFDPGTGADGTVRTITFDNQGRVLVGGDFLSINNIFSSRIARLNVNGSLDTTFNPGGGANDGVYSIAVQTNDLILIAGAFTKIDIYSRYGIARLQPDGSIDLSYDPGNGANGAVNAVILQPDNKAIIGGYFTSYDFVRRMGLARLESDGTLDTSFMDTGYNQFAGLIKTYSFEPPNFLNALALQPDGNVMIGGSFHQIGGNPSEIATLRNPWTLFTREDKRVRYNIARVIGGVTPGPGAAEFHETHYNVDKDGVAATIRLHRLNGRLGTLAATDISSNRTAQAGSDFVGLVTTNVWPEFSYIAPISWGLIGFIYDSVPIIDNILQTGDRVLDLNFVQPFGSITLGGTFVPLGGALARRTAPLTIVDDNFSKGNFTFSSATYATNESAGVAIITVLRTNGSVGTVSVDYYTRDSTNPPIAAANVNYIPVRNTLTFLSGETSHTFAVPILHYPAVQFDLNVALVLTNATGGAKLPGGTPVSISTATLTIRDVDFQPGHINFSARTYATNQESDGSATITVTRTGGNANQVSVQFQTLDGTAISPRDYLATNGVLTWNDGNTSDKIFKVPLIQNGLVTGPATVNLVLSNPKVLGLPNTNLLGFTTNATLVIQDSDAAGTVAFNQSFYQADENGGLATIAVIRTAGVAGTGTINFATSPGTALPGSDYVPTNGVLTFLPGEISHTFQVPIIDNLVQDGNRALNLLLSNPTNVTLGPPGAVTLTIIDNESFNVAAGSADVTFRNPVVDGPIYSIVQQRTNGLSEGRLLIAGDFTTVNHVTRNRLARLLTNGVLDVSFDPGTGANGSIRAAAVQADGKLLVGGFFSQVSGTNRNGIARLTPDGKLDTFFNPGSGADNPVFALVIQPDLKILVGGSFSKFNSFTRPGLARLNTNGSVDLSFYAGSGPNDTVYAIALQGDGKVVIGGEFTQVNGTPFNHLARLNPDGSLDATFANFGAGMDAAVKAILVQPDGKLVVGGAFTSVNGTNRNFLARLNEDGSLDAGFMAGVSGGDNTVYALALQIDNKLVVAGDFARFNDVTRSRLTRLLSDGTTDPTINFGSGADAFINTVLIQPDREILIGGGFLNYDDQPHSHIARINGGTIVGPGTLTFNRGEYQVNENGTNAVITVRRRGGTTGLVGVNFNTSDGTALDGRDYVATNGSLAFPNGETFEHFLVPIIDNTVTNDDRFLNLALSGYSGGATTGPQPEATLLILNDESGIGFTSDTFSVSENAVSGNATITFQRTYNTNNTVSAIFSTISGGTAAPNVKYRPTNSVVTFLPGETLKAANVQIINETNIEGNETVFLILSNAVSNPSSTTYIDIPAATLTIVDDDFAPGEFVFSSAAYSVNQYETNITITVLRTNGSSGVVSVQYATIDGSARAGQDYVATSGTLAFSDGETVMTFNIPIIPNFTLQTNGTVLLVLSNPTGGARLGVTRTATLTILQNTLIHGNLNFSAANYVVHESNQVATITVTRSLGFLGAISVTCRTVDGTAASGVEYIGTTNVLSWANGDRLPKTFTVTILTNGIVEGTTSLGLQMLNPQGGASLGAIPAATLTILDDDKGPGMVGFSAASYLVSEDSTNAIITVQRIFGMTGTVSVDFATSPGTALAGTDYTSTNGTLVFLDGETNKTFAIPLVNSPAVENNKTVNLQLSNPTGGAITNAQIISALLVIVENQPQAGSVDTGFSGSGANDQIYSIVIATNQQVVVNNNKLLVGGDFTLFNGLARNHIARLKTDGSLDIGFDAGTNVNSSVRVIGSQADGTAFIGGAFNNFAGSPLSYLVLLQPDGSLSTNFLAGFSGVDNFVYAAGLQADGKVVIGGKFSSINGTNRHFIARLDPDGAVDPSFGPIPGPDGAVRALAIQSDGAILIAGEFASVDGVPLSRLARLLTDGSVDLAFAAAIGNGADNTITSLGLQPDGKLLIAGLFTNWNGSPVGRIIRLNGDGSRDPGFVTGTGADEFINAVALQGDGKVLAGGGFTSYNGTPCNRIMRLNTDGSFDTSINFGSGANSYVSTIAVQSDKKIVVGGAFTQFNSAPHNYLVRLNGGDNFGSGEFVFDSANYSVAENGTNITITVVRQIGVSNSVSVDFSTSDGTAVAPVNYLGTNGTMVFAPGETFKTFVIPVIDDGVTNVDRTVNLLLSNPQNLSDPLHPPTLGVPSASVLTILDNDSVVGFTISDYSVSKSGSNAVITVQRAGGALGTVTVDFATSDGTAVAGTHYFSTNGTLVFTNGQRLQTFGVPIIDNTNVQGNLTVNLTLTRPTGAAVLGLAAATLTIVDDVFSPGLVGFSQANFTVSELASNVVITVVRSPGSSGSASVHYSTSDGTANAGVDYLGASGLLAFADGEFSKTFSVRVLDDFSPAVVEGPSTVKLTLSNPVGAALGQGAATITIVEDTSVFNFSATNYSVVEDQTNAIITVVRTGGGPHVATVDFLATNLTAVAGVDFVTTNGTLTFAPGQTNATFAVPLIHDNIGQPDRAVLLTLSNPSGEATLGPINPAILTIVDDSISFDFSAPNYLVNESGGNAVITVLRVGRTNAAVSVSFNTSDGTARAGRDYQFTSAVLNFAVGQVTNTVLVPIINNGLPLGNITVNLNLSSPTNGTTLGAQNTAILTILHNEDVLSLSSTTYFVDEAPTNVLITVVRTGVPGTNGTLVTVRFATSGGTARAGVDYIPTNGFLTFNVFETAKSFSIPILDDGVPDGDETVNIQLSNATGGATLISPTTATLTILDSHVGFRFSSSAYSVLENQTNAVITVNRLGALSLPTSVGYATSNGTAVAGINYLPVSGVLFFPPGVTNQTFLVPLIDDLRITGNQTVNLSLFNPTGTVNPGLLSPSKAVLTIINVDNSTIVPAGSALLSETIPNGVVDPGETVTINFGLRNIGNIDTANLVATLLPTNGVTAPSGPRVYGAVFAGGATVSRPFTFTAVGTNGGVITATFHLQDGASDLGTVTFAFTLGRARFTFVNSAGMTIPAGAPQVTMGDAAPYPSTIVVSNVPGSVSNLTVSLYGLAHTYPPDIDILMTSPQANGLIVMSDCGGFNSGISNVNLTFDDSAPTRLTAIDPIVSGTYRPSPVGPDYFDPPAPTSPYVTGLSNLCNGASPNGTWSLFVVDDSEGDYGFLAGGWSLTIETVSVGTIAADLSVNMVSTPNPTLINQTLHYTLSVTNNGPASANGVLLTNILPGSVTSISAPGCTVVGNVVSCNLGTLASGAGTNIIVSVVPTVAGSISASAVVTGGPLDLNTNNNAVAIKTTVQPEPGLTLAFKNPGNTDLVLSWPTAVTNYNFRIEATDTLSPPHWVPVTGVQTPSGNQITITISATNRSQFFRLSQ